MKLHLPTRLRKALVATFVAVASFATTLSSASLLGGAAVLSFAASPLASAAVVGPSDSYAAGTLPEGTASGGNGSEIAVKLSATEDTAWSFADNSYLAFTIEATGADVKLSGRQDSNNHDYVLTKVQSDSLWLALGSFRVKADSDLSTAGTIYLGGAQMQFVGEVSLANNFVLGESTSTTSPSVLGNTAFRVGHTSASGKMVTLSGAISVAEDAAISFQGGNHLTLSNSLSGTGDLTLQVYNGSSSNVVISGTTASYTGAIISSAPSITLKLGTSAVQTGGLSGSFAVGLDTVAASTLTLNVAAGADLSYTGTFASGVSLVKKGEGTQTLQTVAGDVTVEAGTLNITALDATETIAVSVTGGTLNIGDVSVDLSSWEPISASFKYYDGPASDSSETDGNGYCADSSTYLLFDGYEWLGSVEGYTISQSEGNTYLTGMGTISSIFHVHAEDFTVDGSDTNAAKEATGYKVYKGRTLTISAAQSDTMTVGKILSETIGSGNTKLTTAATMSSAAQVTGKLTVENASLSMDVGRDTDNTYLTSFSSIELNAATINYHGSNTTWDNVTVGSGDSTINIRDMGVGRTVSLSGTTTLNGNLAINSKGFGDTTNSWKYGVNIAALTGTGNLSISGSTTQSNESNIVTAKLLADYTGAITVTPNRGNMSVTLTADGDINLSGLNISGGATVDLSGVQGVRNLGDVAIGADTTLTLSGSVGDMSASGAGTLSFAENAEIVGDVCVAGNMSASALSVAEDGSLTFKVDVTTEGSMAQSYTLAGQVTGVVNLLVSNVGAIADTGVTVFAGDYAPAAANVNVESIIYTDESGNSWVAAYNNGVLTKTAATAAAVGDLTWLNDGTSNNWGVSTSAKNWNNGTSTQAWADGSTVTFEGAGESISVISAVTAASVTVSATGSEAAGYATGYEWLLGADKLTITNGVTIGEHAELTISGASATNFSGIISGAGSLRLKNAGLLNLNTCVSSNLVFANTENYVLNTLILGEGTALELANAANAGVIDKITHIVVESGGRFDLRHDYTMSAGDEERTLTIAGAGDASLTGSGSGVLAALSLSYGSKDNMTIGRKVILSDDATIAVKSGKTGKLTGGLDTAGHTLTLIGGGRLQWEAAELNASKLVLNEASILRLYRTSSATPSTKLFEIDELQVSSGVTLQAASYAPWIKIGELTGSGTWNMAFEHRDETVVSSVLVSGDASFSGTINVSVAANPRTGIFSTNDHDALSKAVIHISDANVGTAGFALANDGSETVQVAGLSSAATVEAARALLISNDEVSASSDDTVRTLEIVGAGEQTFAGTVLANVNLLMNGSGKQTFAGNMDAFNGTVEVQKGTLSLASLGSTSGITLAGTGATLEVTGDAGVSGRTLTATAVGAVLSADLTMAGGTLNLGTTDAVWAKEGGLSLNNHKLVLDTANMGTLVANLGEEEYTGEVVQLLTHVSGIVDANDAAISIDSSSTHVGDLFNTGSDDALGDYLLDWNETTGTLSLIMKSEVSDLVWDDDSKDNDGLDDNTWKNSGDHKNWLKGDEAKRFVMGDNVSFSGEGETVTIEGTVNPFNATVESGTYSWSGSGSVEASGALEVNEGATLTVDNTGNVSFAGGVTVNDGATLTIANTGNKIFAGGVTVNEGATLTVQNATGWEGKVSGDGSLLLATGNTVDLATYIDTDADAKLGMLSIGANTRIAPTSSTTSLNVSDALAALSKVTILQLAGAKLEVNSTATLEGPELVKVAGMAAINVAEGTTLTMASKLQLEKLQSLFMRGAGTLVLAGGAEATTGYNCLLIQGGTVQINDASVGDTLGSYAFNYIEPEDGETGSGTLVLTNGNVNVGSFSGMQSALDIKVVTEGSGDIVAVSGIKGSDFDSITLAGNTQLTGVTGNITVGGSGNTTALALTLDAVNVGSSATIADNKKAMIEFSDAGSLIINDGASVTLTVDAIASALSEAARGEESVYLHLTTGTLSVAEGELGNLDFRSDATSIELLEQFGLRLSGTEGGSLKLTGGASGIYVVPGTEDPDDVTVIYGYKELSAYQSTVVSGGETLELVLDGPPATEGDSAVINNLIGGTDSVLLVSNTVEGTMASMELVNKRQDIADADPAEAVGADTEFAGMINGTGGAGEVEVIISGPGTLTVGGNVEVAQLSMHEGGLTLNSSYNHVDTLADDGVAEGATGADATLTVNDRLVVSESGTLSGTRITGIGVLELEADLTLSDAATLDGVTVKLQKDRFGADGSLSLNGVKDAKVSDLIGDGTLQGGEGAVLTVTGSGGNFGGTLTAIDTENPGKNTLRIAENASQTLDRVSGSTAWSVENDGELIVNITNPAVTTGSGTNKVLTLDTLTLKDGSETTLVVNTDAAGPYLNLKKLVVESGTTVSIESTGLDEVPFNGSLTLAKAAEGVTLGDDVTVNLGDSAAFKKVSGAELSTDGRTLTLQTTYYEDNQYATMATTENAQAGATLLWSVNTGSLTNGSSLKAVDEAVHALLLAGTDSAAARADEIMAAVAGSSTAILGSALAGDVERQLRAIRNRTTTMGVSHAAVNEDMPYYNAWINAEGDHHELDADGTAAGYTRDSWGGTVGFDMDLTPHFTMGLAVTAMYGDIESDGADTAEGDFDTQYLSVFARYSRNAWTHTFVATVGRADITLDRTVNYDSGSYETKGETEGMAFGFMYEVGRVYSLTEDGDVCLQPVFNVNFRSSTVDAYEETDCDAGLAVDEQTSTMLTFGVGARMQAVIGTSLYNRASILEARALAKFDAGDREGEADVRLLHGGDAATVKSAEVGAVGAEVGLGVTIPMGSNAGAVFIDGSAELRSGYTNLNGTVGYRVNF